MAEQIRQLTNRVELSGALMDLTNVTHGTTKAGVDYVSFRGRIRCGTDKANEVDFRSFIKAKKSNGDPSKTYESAVKWLETAVPMTKDPENPTMVDFIGSIADHAYVDRSENLREDYEFNVNLISQFHEYKATINLEAYIANISPEVVNDNETGNMTMRLFSQDVFHNTLDIKNVIIPEELVNDLSDAGYEAGATGTLYLDIVNVEREYMTSAKGFGVQRETRHRTTQYLKLVGGLPAYPEDSEEALSKALMKKAMNERKARLDEIKANGYLGNTSNSSNSSNSTKSAPAASSGFGAKAKPIASPIDDDDFPF